MPDCEGKDGVNWDEYISCAQLPLSTILLLFVSAGWGGFLAVSHLRALRHTCSRTREVVVAKKLQILQMWFYSYFYNTVYLTSLFSMVSYLMDEYYVSAAFLGASILLSTAAASTIDVVGSKNRKPGLNAISLRVSLDHLTTLYLPKAVWKMSGHREFDDNEGSSKGVLTKLFCLEDVDNHITPKVYDVKDIAAIQGAALGVPALTVYFLSYIRSATGEFSSDIAPLNLLTKISATVAFLSAILAPMLGDWELYARDMKPKPSTAKTIGYSVLGFGKRTLELVGRLGFYVYFIDVSKFSGLALFGIEWMLMRATMVVQRDASIGGRTHSIFHKLYSSFEAVFFGFFRRISVDKDLVVHNNAMSPTIELVRFVIKGVATVVGYIALGASNVPEEISQMQSGDVAMVSALFYASIASNIALVFVEIFEFMVAKRSQLKKADAKELADELRTLICTPFSNPPKHINRDNNMGQGDGYLL